MGIVWRKVCRELFDDKVRTALVVLSVAVGVFALGLVFTMRDAVQTWMQDDYRAANASHLSIRMSPFDYYI